MEILADVTYLKQLKTSYSDLIRIISSVDNECAQVKTTLNATKSKYSNYSYVVSEVNAISKLLDDLKSTKNYLLTEIKKIENGLELAAKMYVQEEKEERQKINLKAKASVDQVYTGKTKTGNGITGIIDNVKNGLDKLIAAAEAKKAKAIEDAYASLPEKLKGIISIDDIAVTDDGFVLITKPLSEVFNELGYDEVDGLKVENYYDDWYLYAVKDKNGNYVYSMMKMRELEHDPDSENYDNDDPGTAIPFVSFDINAMTDKAELDKVIGDVINATAKYKEVTVDYTILGYFMDPKSNASYLIAEKYVEKILKEEDRGGTGVISTKMANGNDISNKRVIEYLESNDAIIFDKKAQTITIKNPEHLSQDAKRAILAIRSGNVSFNSFAAENKFHADYTVISLGILSSGNLSNPLANFIVKKEADYVFKCGIVSDAGIDEEGSGEKIPGSGIMLTYQNEDSAEVKEQAKYHGRR